MGEADECVCSHERYDAVADRVESVHPMGQPISHSTNGGLRTTGVGRPAARRGGRRGRVARRAARGLAGQVPAAVAVPGERSLVRRLAVGVGQPTAAALRFRPPRVLAGRVGPPAARPTESATSWLRPSASVAARRPMRSFIARCAAGDFWSSDATGVGHRRAARSVSVVPCVPVVAGLPPEAFESAAVAVGQQPEAVAAMGGANGGCAETAPFRIEAESGKVPKHDVESSSGQGRDVLEERHRRADLVEDTGDVRARASGRRRGLGGGRRRRRVGRGTRQRRRSTGHATVGRRRSRGRPRQEPDPGPGLPSAPRGRPRRMRPARHSPQCGTGGRGRGGARARARRRRRRGRGHGRHVQPCHNRPSPSSAPKGSVTRPPPPTRPRRAPVGTTRTPGRAGRTASVMTSAACSPRLGTLTAPTPRPRPAPRWRERARRRRPGPGGG